MSSSITSSLKRNLVLGVVWFLSLFTWDALDSWWSLRRATTRIQSDPSTIDALKSSAIEFVLGAAGAYIVMGLMAAIMLHLLLAILHEVPQRIGAWLKSALIIVFSATLLGIARQMITFPTLYVGFPWRRHWAEFAEPGWVDAAWVLAALWLVIRGWRRWGAKLKRTFTTRLVCAVAYAGVIAAVLQPPTPNQAVDNSGTNLVLIGIDALRPDRLGHFGNSRNTSPHIDKFLSESLIYTQAFTQLARTYPAWTTTMSGTWPTTHGIRDNLPTADRLVPPTPLLPQVMADAGFTTGFATDDSRFSYMVPETGFQLIRQPVVGIQNFAISVNEPPFRAFHGLMHNSLGFSFLPVQAYNQSFGRSYRPDQFVDWAVDGLAEISQSERFFYAMHSCVLHVPGDRVYPWYKKFDQKGYRGKNRFRYSATGTSLMINNIESAKGERAKRVAEQDLKIYDSGILMADDLVGGVMAELEESGLIDNTVVVLFSDHGEELWDTDLPYKWRGPNHGFHMYGDGHSNVVFAVRFPDGKHAGKQVSDPIRLIDFAPTIAELFDLEWPTPMNGEDILPLVDASNASEEETEDRLVYMETGLSEPRYWVAGHKTYPFKKVSKRYNIDFERDQVHIRPKFLPHLIAGKDRAVQRGKWKIIWHAVKKGIRVDLYDREQDVLNRIDLAEDHPEILVALGNDLLPFLEADGLEPPPTDQWVTLSRVNKAKDERYLARMLRNSGTLAPELQKIAIKNAAKKKK